MKERRQRHVQRTSKLSKRLDIGQLLAALDIGYAFGRARYLSSKRFLTELRPPPRRLNPRSNSLLQAASGETMPALPSGHAYNESWLQGLLFRHPELLVLERTEAGAGEVMPLCRELSIPRALGSVFLDMLRVTRTGRLVLVECKLWRNPQARRQVVAQIVEHVLYWFCACCVSIKPMDGRNQRGPQQRPTETSRHKKPITREIAVSRPVERHDTAASHGNDDVYFRVPRDAMNWETVWWVRQGSNL